MLAESCQTVHEMKVQRRESTLWLGAGVSLAIAIPGQNVERAEAIMAVILYGRLGR